MVSCEHEWSWYSPKISTSSPPSSSSRPPALLPCSSVRNPDGTTNANLSDSVPHMSSGCERKQANSSIHALSSLFSLFFSNPSLELQHLRPPLLLSSLLPPPASSSSILSRKGDTVFILVVRSSMQSGLHLHKAVVGPIATQLWFLLACPSGTLLFCGFHVNSFQRQLSAGVDGIRTAFHVPCAPTTVLCVLQ